MLDVASRDPRRAKTCGYCETPLPQKNKDGESERTKDHIPPKSWFTESEKQKFTIITVPSCEDCNCGYANKDENAKHFLSLCVTQMGHDTPEQINNHKRTLDRNKRLKNSLLNAEDILVQDTITGIYTLEKSIRIEKQYIEDTKEVMYRIARGLYWYHFNRPIRSADYKVHFLAGVNLRKFTEFNPAKSTERLKLILDIESACTKIETHSPTFTYWISNTLENNNEGHILVCYKESAVIHILMDNMKIGNLTNY